MSKAYNPHSTPIPLATQQVVDRLLADGMRSEAAELTQSAIDYVQTHDYYTILTGLGHLSLGLRDEE